ncbi:MAG: alpha/beta hydrolase [Deltaproteobacteria bacterium]|nr:alpha/beta hydrolase [Deltaproteobacteria bacterium]
METYAYALTAIQYREKMANYNYSPPTQAWMESGKRTEVMGHQVFVYEKGSGPDVILIHGFPTSCHDFRDLIGILEGAFRCVAFDFLGFGLSDKPAAFSYSLFQQTDLIEALAAKKGISEAHIISHDMGTSAHTELLARQQEGRLGFKIQTSTFLNGSMIKDMATLTDFQRMLEDPQRLPEAMQACANMVEPYVPGLKKLMKKPEVISEEDETVMQELLLYQNGNQRIPNVYAYVRERYLHKERWLGALQNEKTPIQFVWATGDPVANHAMGKKLSEMVPQARYTEVEDSGHFIPIEAPATVAEAFKTFIGSDS